MWDKDRKRYKALKDEYDIDTMVVWESDAPNIDIKEYVKQIVEKRL